MDAREAINGRAVVEEQIAAWAAEAEAGYDVAMLKKRGRGRPGRGAEPSQVVALRRTTEELVDLEARAFREGRTRSEIIREALAGRRLTRTLATAEGASGSAARRGRP